MYKYNAVCCLQVRTYNTATGILLEPTRSITHEELTNIFLRFSEASNLTRGRTLHVAFCLLFVLWVVLPLMRAWWVFAFRIFFHRLRAAWLGFGRCEASEEGSSLRMGAYTATSSAAADRPFARRRYKKCSILRNSC